MNLETIAKIVLGLGVTLLLVGGILFLAAKLGWTRLPGDLVYRGRNVTVYAPVGLMILVSIIATIMLSILSRR